MLNMGNPIVLMAKFTTLNNLMLLIETCIQFNIVMQWSWIFMECKQLMFEALKKLGATFSLYKFEKFLKM